MSSGSSLIWGKDWIKSFILWNFPAGSFILDMGAGCGTYSDLLGGAERYAIDGVELWVPNAMEAKSKYRRMFISDVRDFDYGNLKYDLVIFGDILEHLTVADAQQVLADAQKHSKHILVAIPFQFPQEPWDENVYERHIQGDLTPENVRIRYPELICVLRDDHYGYYFI